ncbi:MAG TPA: acyltransferase [Deltaproteobacteria bacterium]|nr:acyltransferase [Deltaproteobacteria bacterium]
MRIGFVQYTPCFGEVDHNIETVLDLIGSVRADLLVLPELCMTGYLITSRDEIADLAEKIPGGKTTEALCRTARERSCHIVAGLAERSGDNLYNSAVLVGPDGYIGHYRKLHLFFEEKLWFTPGDGDLPVFDLGTARVGIMICFDWIFPEATRSLALKGAQVICHPANLVLPFCQDAMKTRCLENRVFAVTANRTGVEKRGGKVLSYTGMSQITGPEGAIIHRCGGEDERALVVEIDPARADNKAINEYNDIFRDRRPEYYAMLLKKKLNKNV